MPSDARTQWAAYELQRRLQRADTPTEQASVWRDAERAQQDPEFLARLAEIAERGKYSSGPWGLGKLALAGGTLAGLIPGLQPLGLASGAALAGLAIPTGLEAIQRRSEGLPWKWQAAESALDLAAPGVSKLGGLLRGLRGVKPQTTQALVRVGQPPPPPRTGAERVGDVWQAPGQVQTRAERVAEETMRRGTHPDQLSMPQALARMSAPLEGTVPTMGRSVRGTPGRGFSPGVQRLDVPGMSPTNPQTGRPFTEFELLNREAQRVAPSRQSLQVDPALTARFNRPLAGTTPITGASRAATPGVTSVTNPLTGRPYTEFELLNLRAGRTGATPASPDAATPGFGGVPATGTWGKLGGWTTHQRPSTPGGTQRTKTTVETPTGTPEPTDAAGARNASHADAAVEVAKSPPRAADEVLSAMEADVDKLTGVTEHQAAFLRSFLGQIDDFGDPVLQQLRAGDVPAQEKVFDRVLRFIDQQRLGPGVKPRERGAIGHLYASGGLGGGMSKNVPGLPSGWLAASPGRVMKTTKEGRELRGTFPGMENVSVGAAGQPVPHFTALTELPIGKDKASDIYRRTVRASKAGKEEWDDVEGAVRASAEKSGVSISNDQVALVTAYRVAYDRFDSVYKYIKHVVGKPHRGVQGGPNKQFTTVEAYHPIWKQSHKTGDPRTAMGDMRSVIKRVASGEWDTSKIQTIVKQLNSQAMQLLGVIGSIEMARRVLAPGQTPNATLT